MMDAKQIKDARLKMLADALTAATELREAIAAIRVFDRRHGIPGYEETGALDLVVLLDEARSIESALDGELEAEAESQY